MKLRLNSAKAEAQASSLSLAELGNIFCSVEPSQHLGLVGKTDNRQLNI